MLETVDVDDLLPACNCHQHRGNWPRESNRIKHFSEWERAGVTRIWLRNSDLSERYPKPDPNCDYSYTGNYNQWAANEPKCRETSNSCAYATTSATQNNWLADYCSLSEAFACEIDPGKMLHSAEKPVNDHHCPESGHWKSEWALNTDNNKCYLIGRNSIDDGSAIIGTVAAQKLGISTYCQLLR